MQSLSYRSVVQAVCASAGTTVTKVRKDMDSKAFKRGERQENTKAFSQLLFPMKNLLFS